MTAEACHLADEGDASPGEGAPEPPADLLSKLRENGG